MLERQLRSALVDLHRPSHRAKNPSLTIHRNTDEHLVIGAIQRDLTFGDAKPKAVDERLPRPWNIGHRQRQQRVRTQSTPTFNSQLRDFKWPPLGLLHFDDANPRDRGHRRMERRRQHLADRRCANFRQRVNVDRF